MPLHSPRDGQGLALVISDIRHTALRRTICVLSAPLYLAAVAICGALVAIDEAWVDVVAAWRGPRTR